MALYNKYRPTNFNMVCGQDIIKKVLTNQVKTGKLSNAYVFTGPAGTGKTTVARIFAAMVNAKAGMTTEPSMEDDFVNQIMTGKGDGDVLEFDAATNGGIDSIREMKEKAAFSPIQMRKKIWIIDECHRLTSASWEGLLKLLEEPPEHAIFILCTTEVDKVTDTVLTRSMCLRFKPITSSDVSSTLKMIATKEGIDATDDALKLITNASGGSLRMAISNLEKAAAVGGKLTEKEVMAFIGAASSTLVRAFVQAIVDKDFTAGLAASSEMIGSGVEIRLFFEELANLMHNMLLARKLDLTVLNLSQEESDAIKVLRERFTQKRREMEQAAKAPIKDEVVLFSSMIDKLNNLHGYTVYNMQPQYLANLAWITLYKEFINMR